MAFLLAPEAFRDTFKTVSRSCGTPRLWTKVFERRV